MKEKILSVTIHDCEVQTFRAGGPGGQNQNKRDTGVRVIHHPSGARGECREHRTQHQNKRQAFIRMTESQKFKLWVKIQTGQLMVVEERVRQDMNPKNLLVEGRSDSGWVQIQ